MGSPVPLAGSAAFIAFSILLNKGFGSIGGAINTKRNKPIFPVNFMQYIFLNWFTYARIQNLYITLFGNVCTYSEISDTIRML